jgi:O-antigen/teichoic acid export membrane protein
MSESKSRFLRQSLWMIAATLGGGVGMALVHGAVSKLGGAQTYFQFKSLLAVFYVVGAAQGALWTLTARRTATALTPEAFEANRADLRRSVRTVALAMGVAGLMLLPAGPGLAARWNLPSVWPLWITWALILTSLMAALQRGVLQGRQDFAGLGAMAIADGLGRFAAVVAILGSIGGGAAGAIGGALIGTLLAMGAGFRALRPATPGATLPTPAAPDRSPEVGVGGFWTFFLGAAALQAMAQLDNLFLQDAVPGTWQPEVGARYSPGAQVGFALSQFTVPLALVMFPKVARGASGGDGRQAFGWTLGATAVLGGLAALGCTLLPWLPVRILLPGIPVELSAPLVPWFAWGMLAFTLANVLFSDRMAHGDFRFVPGAALLAIAYAVSLWGFRESLLQGTPAEGLARVVQRVVIFNGALLAWAVFVSLRARRRSRPVATSEPPSAPAPPAVPPPAGR